MSILVGVTSVNVWRENRPNSPAASLPSDSPVLENRRYAWAPRWRTVSLLCRRSALSGSIRWAALKMGPRAALGLVIEKGMSARGPTKLSEDLTRLCVVATPMWLAFRRTTQAHSGW